MRHVLLGIMAIILALFIACGSNGGDSEAQMQNKMSSSGVMEDNQQMKSSEDWIRTQPVDVKALDLNQDGYVYQDPMDWNVIADEEGKCPKCGMFLIKVTIDEAIKNLKDNGYAVK
jgi:hypothetical protein